MPEIENTNLRERINAFLTDLLVRTDLDALLVPLELPSGDNVVPTLVTDSDKLKLANLIAPVLPVNSAPLASALTRVASGGGKVGVVLHPCEERALIELVKLNQASLEDLILLGIDCFGTYSVQDYAAMVVEGTSPAEERLRLLREGREDLHLRSACQICEYFVPQNVDLVFILYGIGFEGFGVEIRSEKGERVLEGLGVEGVNPDGREELIAQLVAERLQRRDEFFAQTRDEVSGWDTLVSFFARCINCHNCMRACPICYCRECFFESSTFEFEMRRYLGWAERKGGIRMPTDTLLFHLTRMNHMVTSCVGCGFCEDACPQDIPLLRLFRTVAQNAQQLFGYEPGRSLEEEIPLTTFREEEFQEIGE